MTKSRNVILFGAGAVLDWRAPSTAKLTEMVRNSGFLSSDGQTRITEFIYQHLHKDAGYPDDEINFETIINVIEELVVYYSEHGRKKKLPALIKGFFSPTFENELLNFAIEGDASKRFKLEIPKGVRSEYAATSNGEETPAQFFLQQLIAHLLTDIVALISSYSYHSLGKSEVITEENKELNEIFAKWIEHINGENILRMFTLNYDRNFKIILENGMTSYKIFEGFECGHAVDYGARLIPDIQKILTDTDSNVHYNLHGCAFWGIEARNGSRLSTPQFILTAAPVLPVNFYEHSTFQSEKGKTIMLTNIITGYQKTQKGIFAPFRQMQATFDKDCCIADTIYIVGYSFGDEHINMTIRIALLYNPKVKFVIIDPSFTKNDFDLDVALKIFSYLNNMNLMQPRTIGDNVHSFFNGRVIVHTKKFSEYMKSSLGNPFEII
ncbi:hypothetical protein ASE74_23510 [Pedobacter sp. Leaf216]|uniref:SIR2 family protein n=1 Tax=Pedobacter sp. Leaf216 TaxID=1735684 RepID=UPI0006FB51DA|nr:SIR2 family protein [Pedobacter sp. Leaf216]KQM70351.1 hypothetical protein ASE74_23510 [Pedobacter sp. Leaf216]